MTRRQFSLCLLASGMAGRTQAVWSATPPLRWKVVEEFRHSSDINVEQVDFSPEHHVLASWATDGSVNAWNVKTKSQILSRTGLCTLGGIRQKQLTFAIKDQVKFLSLPDGKETPFNAVLVPSTISANGEWWAGLRDGKLPGIWNSRTLALTTLGAPLAAYRPENRYFDFSRDGKWLVIGQSIRAYAFDVKKTEDPVTLPDQPGEVTCVRLSHDGRVVVMGSNAGTVEIYDRMAGKSLRTLQFKGAVRSLSLDASRNQLLVACSDGANPLASVPLPNPKDFKTNLTEPTIWETGGEAWSCWLYGDTAVSGHPGGRIKLWKQVRG